LILECINSDIFSFSNILFEEFEDAQGIIRIRKSKKDRRVNTTAKRKRTKG